MDEDTPFIGIGAIVEETEPNVKTASGRIKSSPSNAPNVKKIDVSIICCKTLQMCLLLVLARFWYTNCSD